MSMQPRMPYNPMAINKYPPPPPSQPMNMGFKNPMMQMNRGGYSSQGPMQYPGQFNPPPPNQHNDGNHGNHGNQ